MGLFDTLDSITRKLNTIGQEAINQGSAFADTAKNKFKAADIEKQLTAAYAELGKKYFETIKNSPAEDEKEIVTKISDLIAQAEFYRAEARKERGITLCPTCGAEVSYGTAYCSSCGGVVPQPGVITTVTCPQCGTTLPGGTAFCTSCGTNVQNVQVTATQMPLGQVDLNGGSISSPIDNFNTAFTGIQPQNTASNQTLNNTIPSAAPTSAPVAAPAQPTGFPVGGPADMKMDFNSGTVYGDTNASSASGNSVSLDKKPENPITLSKD